MGVGVLELECQLVASGDAAIHRITHFGLRVLEAIGQCDAGSMFLACSRAFYRFYIGLGYIRNSDRRLPLLAVYIEGDWGEKRFFQIGADRRKDLPV